MIDFKNTDGIYFIGIGGIGMSALAHYFTRGGFITGGYDRCRGKITDSLADEGSEIIYEDKPDLLPDFFKNSSNKNRVLIVYTPAIPPENRILTHFRNNGYNVYKRSEILGKISEMTETLAVAGTHGKTTVSTMIAHLLKQSEVDCSAFLGGISKNYNTNLLTGGGKYTVIEADEFDRSFLRLKPQMAVITALDADHLDIYGDKKTMIEAYNEFCRKVKPGGFLVVNNKIREDISVPDGVTCFTYGFEPGADYRSFNIESRKEHYVLNLKTPEYVIEKVHFPFPGIINVENITAAVAIALLCGVTIEEIRKAMITFTGVKRRFDIRINMPGLAYVDDYAHHPEEIKAFILSAKAYFKGRKITGIFQPHLFSRTYDHAEGFASSLDELDEVMILPVYPAREKPVPGVSSELIFNKMKSADKKLLEMEDLPGTLDTDKLDVLVTIGAGDIDTLVGAIEEKLRKDRS
jgi:UDP-N-acetylmuramate--alanine ligase